MSLFCLLKKRFENKFALFASIFEHFDLFVLVWAECFLIIREDYLIRIQVLECSGLGISRRKKDSKKICTRPRKHARVHAKKNSFKKTRTRTRKRPRKKVLGQENTHASMQTHTRVRVRVFLIEFFLRGRVPVYFLVLSFLLL